MSEHPRTYLTDRDPGDERPLPPLPCPTCGGEGRVADSDDQEPWSAWRNLPEGSNAAVKLGFIRPIDCPTCGGTGRVEIRRQRISPERLAALEAATADGARPNYIPGVGFVEYADTSEVAVEFVGDEQPLPTPGQADVTPVARAAFNAMLDQREQKGIATYGRSLQTWNGRDAHQDLAEEVIDLWQYATQARMERDDLVAERDALRARVAELEPVVFRYHVFAFDTYYPSGGMHDYLGAFDTEKEAVEAGRKADCDVWEVAIERAGKLVRVGRRYGEVED